MKIKVLYIFIICVTLINTEAFSQGDGRGKGRFGREHREELESARVSFITEKLALTPSQAEKFWPIYNDYNSKKEILRKKRGETRKKIVDNLDEKQALELIQQHQANKQKEVDLDKKYTDKLLTFLSTKQVLSLISAEVEFRRLLLERLRDNKQ